MREITLMTLCALVWSAIFAAVLKVDLSFLHPATPTISIFSYESPRSVVEQSLQVLGKRWNKEQINKLVTALEVCDAEYGVSPRTMMGIILTESDMTIRAVSGPNWDGSYDYGLVQQNGRYLVERYAAAKKTLDRLGIKYTNNRYDIMVNVVSGAVTIAWFRKELMNKGVHDPDLHLVAYNVGPTGATDPRKEDRRQRYLDRFNNFYAQL